MSPTLIVARIAVIIFVVEGLIRLVLSAQFPVFHTMVAGAEWGLAVVNATALVLISGPLIFLWVVRPYVLARADGESALWKSESRLNEAQRIAQIGSWELDLRANVLWWSDEIYRIFEIDPAKFDASYEAFLDAIHPEDREMVDKAYTDSLADRSPYDITHRLRMLDGRIKWMHERCETKFGADGKPLISLGTVQDITEQKQAQETLLASEHTLRERVADLEEAQRKLEVQGEDLVRLADDLLVARDTAIAADRAKSEFLAAMSHELRTPLNAILGFSEIVKNEAFGPLNNVKYREYTSDIHHSGQHLLGLINDILDLSKVESGQDELHEDKIEIPEIVSSVLRLVGQRAEQGGVKIQVELPDQLPALRADKRKLKQILVNLLSNAIKFTDAGGEVAFWVWYRIGSGYVFQIADTGIGIAPEDIPKALSRFGQVDGDLNRQYEGTGLGLPLTKALVEQHGGTLDLQSEFGAGTTVTVRFPAVRIIASEDKTVSLDEEDREAS